MQTKPWQGPPAARARADVTGGFAQVRRALADHWPEYLIEAWGLGAFMVSVSLFAALLEHPASPVRGWLPAAGDRRLVMATAMGLTAIAIIYSRWGKRSGAHINPSLTLAFLRLGRVAVPDAAFYVAAQFAGAALGVALSSLAIGKLLAEPTVNFVATVPGEAGPWVAFAAEAAISFGLMLVVLTVSNQRRLNRYTGLCVGLLVALYVVIEAPLSGMSMNPARSFGSALFAGTWEFYWLYVAAPLAGMLAAAELFVRVRGDPAVLCCKLHHDNDQCCIFRCRYPMHGVATAPAAGG